MRFRSCTNKQCSPRYTIYMLVILEAQQVRQMAIALYCHMGARSNAQVMQSVWDVVAS
jgi:hypothetical protein